MSGGALCGSLLCPRQDRPAIVPRMLHHLLRDAGRRRPRRPHEDCLPGDEREPIVPAMTICVGVLCNRGKAAVLAADRLAMHPASGHRADGPDCKVVQVRAKTALAAAGVPPDADFREECGPADADEPAITAAEAVYHAYTKLWRRRALLYCQKWREFRDYDEFQDAWHDDSLPPDLMSSLVKEEKNLLPGMSFLVAGVDGLGAQLYKVADGNPPASAESPGYLAVGSGEPFATPILSDMTDVKNRSVAEAVYLAYDARKAAEQRRDVGKGKTDIAVITAEHGVQFLDDDAVKHIDDIYRRKRPPALAPEEVASISEVLPTRRGGSSHT